MRFVFVHSVLEEQVIYTTKKTSTKSGLRWISQQLVQGWDGITHQCLCLPYEL